VIERGSEGEIGRIRNIVMKELKSEGIKELMVLLNLSLSLP